jgi:Flp pilus assembly protein TadG
MRCAKDRDAGYVVAETAVVLPTVVLIVVAVISMFSIASIGLGLQDAVHSASRQLARGASVDEVRELVSTVHPQIVVTVTPSPQGVAVTARREIGILRGFFGGLSVPMVREATVPWEMGVLGGTTG